MQNEGKAVFWSLRQKFLDSDDDMPAQAQQVMYYSLAIGHHVGVIDCLNTELSCPLPQYQTWVELFPEGEAQRKMRGLLTFGEITIDSTHTSLLANALAPLIDSQPEPFSEWSAKLLGLLAEIEREPAIYLIVKKVTNP
ncbi:formate hydrogenlyase maturation HycH family protein [Serratia fonticola]|jgi:hydrogenase-4 component J|uniref:formate hydrogenlyase maturation HycH family protein n=1 Tax=Serratia fonticola TaxID=47917 RepID=UPI00217B5F3D|nr:formate hydrogenlyase maturation HycH family protein [Serratia fonticola]CAI1541355.1 formate hydrogenlyase maturation protein HycH [Serratia fonticola]CAI1582726.1 formate hydrogenlyase maturation protein HycH [Serratia fonticola]CAI1658633.1 formate hydrogenlyase maturation protein HycH [Serratia fonticola]CAI1695432.1 formate hydrogenlyase maturation protein HycH [Serratia fonticola]